MNKKLLVVDKPIGVTPLQVIEKIKANVLEYKYETISYAGRLDPMAHGVLLLLVGEENKNREKYLHLDKMYQVEMLFGFTSDTYDILGLVTKGTTMDITRDKIERMFPRFIGKRKQPYPPFSSQPVNGKPLFYWARNNMLSEVTIPAKDITIHSIQFLSLQEVMGDTLEKEIVNRITKVSGDFRQKEVLASWRNVIDKQQVYKKVKCTVFCSSGTYVRSITHDIGKYIGCGALAFDIYRTQVGTFTIGDSFVLD